MLDTTYQEITVLGDLTVVLIVAVANSSHSRVDFVYDFVR